jgi:hypothetical protein
MPSIASPHNDQNMTPRAHPTILARAMERSTRQLEPVIGNRAATLTPWASLWVMAAAVLGLLVFLPTYLTAAVLRSPILVVAAIVVGVVMALALAVGSIMLVKINRAAGRVVSARLGTRIRFWGAYATGEAWQRAIRRKARHLPDITGSN